MREPMAVLFLAATVAACGSTGKALHGASSAGAGAQTSVSVSASASVPTSPVGGTVPLVAGPLPSAVSTMVCSSKAQAEIAGVLGATAAVSAPTWVDHLYSCRFSYPAGSMLLSVKELSSVDETTAYFQGLAGSLGNTGSLANLGQGAFVTTDGSVVVRKDYKVLLVDVSGLRRTIGDPPDTPAQAANTVADVILGCWAGD